MKRLLPLIILVVGLGIAAILIATGPTLETRERQPVPPLINAIEVIPETVAMNIIAFGAVTPRTESDLVPEVAGRIVTMSPSMVSGGFFSKGDILIRIDPLDYQVALEQARARLVRAESDLHNAKNALSRQLELAKKQSTSESLRDDAQNRFRIAKATLQEARALLSRSERDLKRTNLIAPYDGRVRSESIDVGQFVTRGRAVARLYATDFAEVRLPLHDEELAHLNIPLSVGGQDLQNPVKVTLRTQFAGRQHEWLGTIVRTEGELDPSTRMIVVIARVPSPYAQTGQRPPLSVGLFVEATLYGPEIDNVMRVPRVALRSNGEVFVVDANNQLRARDVEVIRVANDQVFIQSGLNSGERVCISSIDHVFDGMKVRLGNPISSSVAQGI
ncbi:MAG: efflux RND transporter periplasmic adaptor subunit [Pseudomonadales bacterium]|nr:efflux RND transporter periplasmic adaptor subunit [Pseudomonadales bacterium]